MDASAETERRSDIGSYTAKLIDGPLEGRTIRHDLLESGDPQPRIDVPAGESKHYVYVRAAGLEYEGDERPSAADYRFLETVFD